MAILSGHMGCHLTPDEIIDDFKSFYYETALSAHETTLKAVDSFVSHEQLLFGTDFPGAVIVHDCLTSHLLISYSCEHGNGEVVHKQPR